MKAYLFILLTWGISMQMMAQPQQKNNLPGIPATTNVRGALYPRILPTNRVAFEVKAPEATTVQLDLGKKYDMTRNENGVWTCTTESLSEGFHYYFLLIDGVAVNDPSSETFYGCSRMTSGIEIPYAEGINHFYLADVPHGEVRMNRYYSKISNKWKRMFVYTPYGYDATNQSYPVMYLLHGGGEDERGWSQQGRTDVIMDNLIAQGKATPMVIAMLDGNTSEFEKELLEECIPLVEKRYRIKNGKENRALAGLSMGGIQTLNVGIMHPHLFNYIGVFSSGWWATPPTGNRLFESAEKYYSLLEQNSDGYNQAFKEFWFSMGGEEDIAYNNCQIMLKRFSDIGIKYTYYETPGGHTWPVWRESLYQFAPLLFK